MLREKPIFRFFAKILRSIFYEKGRSNKVDDFRKGI